MEGKAHITDMKAKLNQMPNYKREEQNCLAFVQLAEDCMKVYDTGTMHEMVNSASKFPNFIHVPKSSTVHLRLILSST